MRKYGIIVAIVVVAGGAAAYYFTGDRAATAASPGSAGAPSRGSGRQSRPDTGGGGFGGGGFGGRGNAGPTVAQARYTASIGTISGDAFTAIGKPVSFLVVGLPR